MDNQPVQIICPQCKRYGVLTNGKCDSCRKVEDNNSLPGGHVNWLRGKNKPSSSGPPTPQQTSSMADTCPPGNKKGTFPEDTYWCRMLDRKIEEL